MNETLAAWQISARDLAIGIIVSCDLFLVIEEVLVTTILFFNNVEAKTKFLLVNSVDVTTHAVISDEEDRFSSAEECESHARLCPQYGWEYMTHLPVLFVF